MSVAPGGRVDMIWNDTRTEPEGAKSAPYHASSFDGGVTWSANKAITPEFNHFEGWLVQASPGDGSTVLSDDCGAMTAYAATFNREQDIYFLGIAIHPQPRDGPSGWRRKGLDQIVGDHQVHAGGQRSGSSRGRHRMMRGASVRHDTRK